MSQIRLRPAEPCETDQITALACRSKAYWGYGPDILDRFRDMLTLSVEQIHAGHIVVADQDGTLLGFYQLGGEPPDGELMDMFLEPTVIGTGLGRRLWQHAVGSARICGFETLTLESDPHAEPFYLRMGADRIGQREVAPGRLLPVMRASIGSG